jgi:phosphopantothenoylcysteine decarboxylase/phosphopantothenate--cysteine ligase
MTALNKKLVVLGVSGGISAYRACELARLLVKQGATVQCLLTEYGAKFVGPLTFQAICGRPAEVGHGGRLANAGMDHIDLGRDANVLVVAPATANTLAKMAHGLADNLLTTTLLASTCPVVLAPAMNTRMWKNPITKENMARLGSRSRFFQVGPDSGSLACGEEGPGRMAEPEAILQAVLKVSSKQDLEGKKIVVSAGPTREALDPIRFLSNRSSGKMGFAVAAKAALRGARVTLVAGPCGLATPGFVQRISVSSAAEMAQAVFEHSQKADVIIMAAAVADFRPSFVSTQKIKKTDGDLQVQWERCEDILAALGRKKGGRILVGFAAETSDPLEAAKIKLEKKNLDLVVANDVTAEGAGFEVETNKVQLITPGSVDGLDLLPKKEVADRILDKVVSLLGP